MKKYFEYMDNAKVSDTLHQRLLNLETPRMRPAAWKKYGAAAVALVLVVGAGAWGLNHLTELKPYHDLAEYHYEPNATGLPENANIGEPARPDIAAEDPNGAAEPGTKTDGGYEIVKGEIVSYYMLPYIEYGMAKDVAQMSLDWDLPKGSTRRDLTQADIDALFGGARNLSEHLAWGGYELTGWAAWLEDGSFWGFFINGYMGELDHFEFALTMGNTYPPSCIGYPDGVEQEIWGATVTAYGHDGPYGCSRRVEFLHDGYGFRFDITGSDAEQTCHIVSRVTRWMLSDSGLALDAITSDGSELVHPWEADPNYSVGEPNWEDGVPEEDSTAAYDPNEAADPSYNAPSMETRSPG